MRGAAPWAEGLQNQDLNGSEPEGGPRYQNGESSREGAGVTLWKKGEEQEAAVDWETGQADGQAQHVSPLAGQNVVTSAALA